jgi:hypothetical protein
MAVLKQLPMRCGLPVDILDVENDDPKSWSVMVDAFHFYRIVLRVVKLRRVAVDKVLEERKRRIKSREEHKHPL